MGRALRALQKPGGDEAKGQRPTEHQRRPAPSELLEVLPHGTDVRSTEVVGRLISLASHGLREAGDGGPIFIAELLRGAPEGAREPFDLLGKLLLAFPQARAGPIPGLLERPLGLPNYLLLELADLRSRFFVWHCHP